MTSTDVIDERSGMDRHVDGRSVRAWLIIAVVIAVVTLGLGTWWTYGLQRGGMDESTMGESPMTDQQEPMADGAMMAGGSMMSPDVPGLPAVFAWYDGQPIAFVHPETSDAAVTELLTGMMGSPVITVPALADVPRAATGVVYVFTNGIRPADGPAGPLGFQPDVFDSVPGDLDYSPLRRLVEVAWVDDSAARELTSVEALTEFEARGLVEFDDTGVVVNAPVLDWPGGGR